MDSPFIPFLSRFNNFRNKLAPLGKSSQPALNELYNHVGVGWFKGNLFHILEPLIIDEIINTTNPIRRIQKKIPFAINSTGDLFLFDPINSNVEFFDFSSNTLILIAESINELLNEKLFKEDYHPLLNHPLTINLNEALGPLTTSEIYHAKLPILLGGEKKNHNYNKTLLIDNLKEMISIILQWEMIKKV